MLFGETKDVLRWNTPFDVCVTVMALRSYEFFFTNSPAYVKISFVYESIFGLFII